MNFQVRRTVAAKPGYSDQLSVIIEGKIKTLHDKNRLKEFGTTKPAV